MCYIYTYSDTPINCRTFLQVCQESLELNGRLISNDQQLYQDDLKIKFQQMECALSTHLDSMNEKVKHM